MDMPLGGNVSDPAFQTKDFVFDDAVLVHKFFLLCVMYCWPLTFQLLPHWQLSPKMIFLQGPAEG